MRVFDGQTDSQPESLSRLRRQIREALVRAGVHGEVAADMEVAVGEVLANTHLHAYQRGTGPVFVEVAASEDAVTICIRDEGLATVPPAIPLDRPSMSALGGRGLYLAGLLAGGIEVRVNPGGHGVTVRLAARRSAPAKVEEADERPDLGGG
ncbi:MAG TPA: ATP-binding protein [bacterium]|nr:ATP-binding protein [bacterium]